MKHNTKNKNKKSKVNKEILIDNLIYLLIDNGLDIIKFFIKLIKFFIKLLD